MAIINEWSKEITKILKAQSQMTKGIAQHKVVLGDAREAFVREVLGKFLPENITIGTGEIVDSQGGRSKQIDLVIYRNDFPVLRTGGESNVYLVEGVIAAIEIKSNLNKQELFKALDNSKSVKNLKPSFLGPSLNSYTNIVYEKDFESLTVSKRNSVMGMLLPATFIFTYYGYKSNSLQTFRKNLNEWYYSLIKGGECSADTLPEAIVTEGCVSLQNLSNQLGIETAGEEDLNALVDVIKKEFGIDVSNHEIIEMFNVNSASDLIYGLGLKADKDPLQYLISSLIETVTLRLGQQQFGSLPVVYNLINYHMSGEMEGNWQGAAVNYTGITCPRRDYLDKLNDDN